MAPSEGVSDSTSTRERGEKEKSAPQHSFSCSLQPSPDTKWTPGLWNSHPPSSCAVTVFLLHPHNSRHSATVSLLAITSLHSPVVYLDTRCCLGPDSIPVTALLPAVPAFCTSHVHVTAPCGQVTPCSPSATNTQIALPLLAPLTCSPTSMSLPLFHTCHCPSSPVSVSLCLIHISVIPLHYFHHSMPSYRPPFHTLRASLTPHFTPYDV